MITKLVDISNFVNCNLMDHTEIDLLTESNVVANPFRLKHFIDKCSLYTDTFSKDLLPIMQCPSHFMNSMTYYEISSALIFMFQLFRFKKKSEWNLLLCHAKGVALTFNSGSYVAVLVLSSLSQPTTINNLLSVMNGILSILLPQLHTCFLDIIRGALMFRLNVCIKCDFTNKLCQ